MILVNERTSLCLDALITAHASIVVIISLVGLVFSAGGSHTHFERHLDGPCFFHHGSRPIRSSDVVQNTVKTFSGHMIKC
jgi:hypothetical protein